MASNNNNKIKQQDRLDNAEAAGKQQWTVSQILENWALEVAPPIRCKFAAFSTNWRWQLAIETSKNKNTPKANNTTNTGEEATAKNRKMRRREDFRVCKRLKSNFACSAYLETFVSSNVVFVSSLFPGNQEKLCILLSFVVSLFNFGGKNF